MLTANQILTLAKGQLGVKEVPSGSNTVKYNTEYYGRTVAGSAYPWCCVFIWWLFHYLGADNLFFGGGKTASCTTLMQYAKQHKLWVTKDYKPGDLILFNFDSDSAAEHIGICESTNAGYITCIEGNTSITSDDNGGSVMRRTRPLRQVLGAYRPQYATAATIKTTTSKEATKVTVEVTVLKQGAKGSPVRKLQILLNGLGHSCGTVDGSFGSKTLSAVKAFQKANKLTVDGSVGPATWGKLLG